MSGSTKTTQEGNTVGGHLVGRDLYAPVITLPQKKTLIQTLTEQYRQELAENPQFKAFIVQLQHYMSSADSVDQTVVGLEAKLSIAGRKSYVRRAIALKEIFAKQLDRNRFSQAAQNIYAYILGKIYRLFLFEVRPLLQSNEAPGQVDRVIFEKVLEPILQDLEDNALLINHDELEGMLYFLTGNCHLRWDEHADVSSGT